MAPILATLIANGLPLIADAIKSAGLRKAEKVLGVSIPDTPAGMTPEKLAELRAAAFAHEEALLRLALEDKRITVDAQNTDAKEATVRWQGDMQSDSWLSKNVRPLSLVFLLACVTAFATGSAVQFEVAQTYVDLYRSLLEIVFVAYFGSRGLEKITSIAAPVIRDALATRKYR